MNKQSYRLKNAGAHSTTLLSTLGIDCPEEVEYRRGSITHVRAIGSMVVFTVLAAAVYVVLPMLVGATVERLGFTPKQAGLIASADMLGASLSSLAAASIIHRSRWRGVLLCGIALMTVANLLSGLVHEFAPLCLCRIIAGLGEGILLAIGNASIGETRNPDRGYGLSAAAQVAFATPVLYCMTSILAAHGLLGAFWSLAFLTALSTCLVGYMPKGPRVGTRGDAAIAKIGLSGNSWLGLAGVFCYFVAQGGVWAYLDRIGMANPLDGARVGKALAICSIAGLLGASLASWLNVRVGRLKPLLFATLCTLISLLVLYQPTNFLVFAAMASLFNFAWNFAVPFEMGTLAILDPSRRTIALGGVVVFAGLTVGPTLAAVTIGDSHFKNAVWVGILFSVASLVLFGRLLWPIERSRQNAEAFSG